MEGEAATLRAPLKCRSCDNAKGVLIPVFDPKWQQIMCGRSRKVSAWQLKGQCSLCKKRIQGFVPTKFAEDNGATDCRLVDPPVAVGDVVLGKVDAFSQALDEPGETGASL